MNNTLPQPTFEPGKPRHAQIAQWLRDRIDVEDYAAGDRLPSERELEELFAVSRITVRRALGTLESEGRIFRQQGLGSFVSARRISQGLVHLTDFSQDMRRAGLSAMSRVLHRDREPAPDHVARALELEPGAVVERLDRLRFGDTDPIAFDTTWLPVFYAQLLAGHDMEAETIYEILERDYSVPVVEGRYRIEGAVAGEDQARLLEVGVGSPLITIHRTSVTSGGRPIYFQNRSYRADRVAFELLATRVPEGARPQMRLEGLEPVFETTRSNR